MFSIGLIGGTGDLGTALAINFAKKGDDVMIGSRSKEKAQAVIQSLIADKGEREYLRTHLKACSNQEVAAESEMLIATVPHETAVDTIRGLSDDFRGNQILISAAAPVFRVGNEFHSIESGPSISKQIRQLVPTSVDIATAFQTVPANILYKEKAISADVLVTCDSNSTFEKVGELVAKIDGLRPLYVGSLELSGELERLTAVLLNIAVKNHLRSPTLKINSF